MTINLADNDPRIEYTVADGNTQQVFTVPFEFFDDGDLNVYQDGTLKTLTTHYITADNNDASSPTSHTSGTTGFIHFTTGNVPTASGADIKIVITRSIDIERTTDFPSSGPFNVGSLNTALDKVIAIQADLQDDISRSLRLTDFDLDATLTLPAVDSRKGTVLAFNSTTGAAEAGPQTGNVNTLASISTDIDTVAGIAANVTTVAGINSNVTTVAGISSNVTTVAGIASDVSAVAADATDIGAVAAKATEIGRLGTADAVADMAILGTADVVADMNTLATSAIVTDLDALANLTTEIDALGDITSNITTVAGISSNVTTVAGVAANVTTVAGVASDVTTVAGISSDVAAVENIAANVTTVAGIAGNVTTVAGDTTDIGTVAGISSNVSTVAGISANVTTVAGVASNVTTVAGISANVTTVATNNANVTTVASNISGVNSFAERYRVGSSDPSSSLDEGDLAYNTTDNQLKFYNGSSWNSITAGIANLSEDTTPQLGGNLDLNSNNITGTGNIPAANLTGALPAIDGSALTGLAAFPSGTLMLFQQTAAPTGWTKQTTHNDKALRIVSGTAGTGGSSAFTTALATPSVSGTVSVSGEPSTGNLAVSVSGNIANTTLSNNTIPSHSHTYVDRYVQSGNQYGISGNIKVGQQTGTFNTGSTGGGGAHNHSHNLAGALSGDLGIGNLAGSLSSSTASINVQYVDVIIAAKD